MPIEESFTFGASPDVQLSFSPDNLPSIQHCLEPQAPRDPEPTTLSKSFSFAIPEVWRATKPSLLRWLDDVPVPATSRNDESPAPTGPHGQKRALARDAQDQAQDGELSRQKRAKLRDSWHGLPIPTPKQSGEKATKAKKGFFRRFSNAYQRVVTPSSKGSGDCDGDTLVGPPSRPVSGVTSIDRPKMQFVCVGDSKSGKSSMLLRYYLDTFDESYFKPTQYELYTKTAAVDGQQVDLEIWDTSGDIKLHQLQKLTYLTWDAVFLCFSLTSQSGFQNAQTKWLKEIRTHCGDVPIILVGLQKDERSNGGLWTSFYRGARISAGEGSMAATGMGAVAYMECSAKTGEGVERVLEQGVRSVFDERAADQAARINDKPIAHRLGQALCFA
ncbi:hypothetical protein SLS62_007853 [Diatrype stigma]|uniref:Uncharacterized protein n=1 Tax=Diatrype stigma TaxID=117547 RepID=A0AAN9UMJ7_9PEZI